MYMIEGTLPNSQFNNIPNSIYWAIVTMTTVGYGDITPVTGLGKFLSACVMLIGYTIIAVPTGIVSASMLALGRALGETMAVLMILSPGLNYSIKLLQASQNQTIAANIAAQYPEANDLGVSTLIGTGLILFLITFVVNFIARKLTEKATA